MPLTSLIYCLKISGLWFQVARANTATDIKWDAGVFHLSILDPETLRIQFTGRSRCVLPQQILLTRSMAKYE